MVSVIIVNYNVRYFLEQCLLSVQAALKNTDGEIIVVDNNSGDGSAEFLKEKFPDVHFILNKENKGFATANNLAVSVARGNYILFLNPDTVLPEDCIEKCVNFIRSKNDKVAIGIRMVDGSGKFLKESKRAFPDPLTSLYKLSGLTFLFPSSHTFGRYYLGHLDEFASHEVDVLAGAFIMLPCEILNEVKGFDESFFMYGEDIDLSYRIQQAGFSNFYFAGSTIIHFKGESTKKGSLNYVRMFYGAMGVFVNKHYNRSKAGIYNLFIWAGIGVRGAVSGLARLLRWTGMPVIDILTIFLCFTLVKNFWVAHLLPYLAFDKKIKYIAFPVFTVLFLITSYYSGLYDNGYRQKRMNRSLLISALILFTIYALIPVSGRLSRGVLLVSVALSYAAMSALRWLLIWLNVVRKAERSGVERIVLAGSANDCSEATSLLKFSGHDEGILGRIGTRDRDESRIGDWNTLGTLLKTGTVEKVVYCQGELTFKNIIKSVQTLPKGVEAAFHAAGSNSIIGSNDKDEAGRYNSMQKQYSLANPLILRIKRLLDFCVATIFLLTFPVHLGLKKRSFAFFGNCFAVLFNKKSFVGYAAPATDLPPLKSGILTTTGLSAEANTLPSHLLARSDKIYARDYTVFVDLRLIYRGYQWLS